jgi:hypothetical protein
MTSCVVHGVELGASEEELIDRKEEKKNNDAGGHACNLLRRLRQALGDGEDVGWCLACFSSSDANCSSSRSRVNVSKLGPGYLI